MRGGARARGGRTCRRPGPRRRADRGAAKPSCVDTVLAGLDRRATAGQLVVVGAPLGAAVGPSVDLVKRLPVGGVLLTGRSRSGVAAVAARTAALQQAVTGRVGLLVAADQEGGQVQTLTGPGFSAIPTAVEQGRWSTAKLTDAATGWGGELKAAGVNARPRARFGRAVRAARAVQPRGRGEPPHVRHRARRGRLGRAGVRRRAFPGGRRGRRQALPRSRAGARQHRPHGERPRHHHRRRQPVARAVPPGDHGRGAGRDDLLGGLHPHRRDAARRVLPCRWSPICSAPGWASGAW